MANGSYIPEWLTNIMSAAGASGVTLWFTRRKQSAEAQSSELDNVQKAISIWRQASEDLKKEVAELQREYEDIQKQVNNLRDENSRLKLMVTDLQAENEKLKRLIQ